jgi:hypothetical protein
MFSIAGVANSIVFLSGGLHVQHSSKISNEAFLYDFANDSLLTLPPMLSARVKHTILFLEDMNEIFVLGGLSTSDTKLKSCETLAMSSYTWSRITPMKTARSEALAAYRKDQKSIYVIGGCADAFSNSHIEKYDMIMGLWSTLQISFDFPIQPATRFTIAWKTPLRRGEYDEYLILVGMNPTEMRLLNQTNETLVEPSVDFSMKDPKDRILLNGENLIRISSNPLGEIEIFSLTSGIREYFNFTEKH